jgi:hypothetical protein
MCDSSPFSMDRTEKAPPKQSATTFYNSREPFR